MCNSHGGITLDELHLQHQHIYEHFLPKDLFTLWTLAWHGLKNNTGKSVLKFFCHKLYFVTYTKVSSIFKQEHVIYQKPYHVLLRASLFDTHVAATVWV